MSARASRGAPSYATEIGIVDFLGPAEVVFEAEAVMPVPALVRIVESFEAAAHASMFSMHPTATTVSMRVIPGGWSEASRVRRVWWVEGIQAGAWRVLLNMLDTMHHVAAPLASVRLLSTDIAEPRLIWRDVMRLPFPSRSATLPFELEVERSMEDTSEPLIRLAFLREVDDAALQRLASMFSAWDNLVVRGGYWENLRDREAIPDVEESLSSQQTYLAAADTVEHLLYEQIGDAAAFDALVNMAFKLNLSFGRVASLQFN